MLTGCTPPSKTKPASDSRRRVSNAGGMRGEPARPIFVAAGVDSSPRRVNWKVERRGRDLNPRRTFQHVRDFQSRSLGHSDTSPCCEAEKEGFEPSMEVFTPITP